MGTVLIGVLVLQVLSHGLGLPTGAPTSACKDMMPRHAGVQPQPAPVPYTIHTSSRSFQANQPVTVAIKGPDYTGILLEARSGNSADALGTWQIPPANTRFLQCSHNPQGAITHANTNVKNSSTTYTWMPPDGVSNIYFKATVAQQRTVYWLNVRSETLARSSNGGVLLAAGGSSAVWDQGGLLVLIANILLILFFPS
ncbi:putative defense protein Hdd11 isoform X1 [Scleropages formosus]|uniref:Si:dkey-251i10.2 n=3 Tax=Scleropages formosus TaxID=113540 RepID=A0A8C9V243_SCLFO|nr:putative defense protein Hdd11 isoform X1 [Scleropages formosus]